MALRDVDGLPILAEFEVAGEEGITTEYCVQPISFDPLPGMSEGDRVLNPVDGRMVYPIPLQGDAIVPMAETEDEIEVCDPQPGYGMYVSEAELERLNLARTAEDVVARKLTDLWKRLVIADEVDLDGAGRLVIDGAVVDAGPEHAAMFQSLMATGTVPPLAAPMNVRIFGPMDLAAASIGAAASKFTPLSIDAVLYYIRITTTADSDGWRPDPLVHPETGEEFADLRSFSYNRNDVFKGGVTWLDVPTLTWQTSRILDVVDFAPLPPIASQNGTLRNAAAFAQLADDVRAAILYFHEYEALTGFYMDPVGVDTYHQQVAALSSPAARWAGLPARLVQTERVDTAASVFNPWLGQPLTGVHLRLTVDAPAALASDDVLVTHPVTGLVAFDAQGGSLVGEWGLPDGVDIGPGSSANAAFEVQVVAGAPTGAYELTLDVMDGTDVLASHLVTVEVLDAALTALWTSVTRYVEQGSYAALETRVYNPMGAGAAIDAQLRVTVEALDGELTEPTDVALFSDAIRIPLAVDGTALVGTLGLAEIAEGGYLTRALFMVVASGTPTGWYEVTVEVVDSAALPDVADLYVAAGTTHGNAPTDPGNEPGDPGDPGTDPGDPPAPPPGGGGTAPPAGSDDPDVLPSGACAGVAPGSSGFGDLDGLTAEQAQAIECLAALGITMGTGPGTYTPRGSVYRDMMASFLARLIAMAAESYETAPLPADAPRTFEDVGEENTHAANIDRLAAAGIVDGKTATIFGPNGPGNAVTRAQIASMLVRAIEHMHGAPLPEGPAPFGDLGDSVHAANINKLAGIGIAKGTSADTFNPNGHLTRAQMALLLVRTLGYLDAS